MRISSFLLVLFLFGTLNTEAKEVTGIYQTNFGELTLKHIGSKVMGTYTHANGRVEGSIIGTVFTGWWYQDNGKGKCKFIFTSDFSSFKGQYGYDNAEPSAAWDGRRTGELDLIDHDSNGITGIYETDFNRMMITRRDNQIGGNYKHLDGRINGTLDGNTVTGTWHQSNGEGNFVFIFASDWSSFEGKWGGKDETPTRPWNGTRYGKANTSSNSSSSTSSSSNSTQLYGTFNTDFKQLTFNQKGTKVSGNYQHQNGRIEGTLNGHILTGWWYQDNGKGRLRFVFNSDFSAFSGKWGYNNATPTDQWNGSK